MIKHMVMWKLKDEIRGDPQRRAEIIAEQSRRFDAMWAKIPEISNLAVHTGRSYTGDFYDFVVIMDFADWDALERMQSAPAHHNPSDMEFVAQIRQAKAVVDYEI